MRLAVGHGGGRLAIVSGAMCWALALAAQSLVVAPAYAPSFTLTSGTSLTAALLQPDGQVVLAGGFEYFHGQLRNNFVRLRPDGEVDPTFNPGPGVGGGNAIALAVQPDGKLLVAGSFTRLAGRDRPGLGRLAPDGRLDPTFAPELEGLQFTAVYCVAVQSDGRLLIGGNFASVGGLGRHGVARLNPDGSLDGTFDPGTGIGNEFAAVIDLVLQPDGKVVLAGDFSTVNGVPRRGIARMDPDGGVDLSFDPSLGVGGAQPYVSEVLLTPDGGLLIAGGFSRVGASDRAGIARLLPDGRVDEGFDVLGGAGGAGAQVVEMALLPEGKCLVAGAFTSFAGFDRNGIVQLNEDGAVDGSLDPGTGVDQADGSGGWVRSVLAMSEGKVLITGEFDRFQGIGRQHLARLNQDGTLDETFSGTDRWVERGGEVKVLLPEPDGGLLVGGDFVHANGVRRHGLARLTAAGSVDPSFDVDLHPGAVVEALARDAQGRLVLGGWFSQAAGLPRGNVLRLKPDGGLDESFDTAAGPNGEVYCLAIQADGKVVLGGDFDVVGREPRKRIARLNPDGSLDANFRPAFAVTVDVAEVYALIVQPDGKLLVGGYFDRVNNRTRSHLARLLADGSVDPEFGADLELGGDLPLVTSMSLQPDGRLLIGGSFTTVNGLPRGGVARLEPNGTLEPGFDPGSGIGGTDYAEVAGLLVLPDQKVLIVGDFLDFTAVPRFNVARLNANGSLDPTFDPGPGANAFVNAVAFGPSGAIVCGGAFGSYGGQPRLGLVCLAASLGDLPRLQVRMDGPSAVVSWPGTGLLQAAGRWSGPWEDLPDARSPYTPPAAEGVQFFRLIQR